MDGLPEGELESEGRCRKTSTCKEEPSLLKAVQKWTGWVVGFLDKIERPYHENVCGIAPGKDLLS